MYRGVEPIFYEKVIVVISTRYLCNSNILNFGQNV